MSELGLDIIKIKLVTKFGKYEGYIWSDIEVLSIFRNLNADFET